MTDFLHGIFGLAVIVFFSWAISEQRRVVAPRRVLIGLLIQFVLTLVFLNIPIITDVFLALNKMVLALQEATKAGTSFVFGYLGGGDLPFTETHPGSSFVLAFQALPLVLVISALSALLFHWRILPWVVKGLSMLLQKSMGIGGALGVGTAANIFVGMTESPLLIRPYLRQLTRSELFALMTVGMATIAGTVMVLYASFLGNVIPNAMGHILVASLVSAPAALTVAMIMVPEHGEITAGNETLVIESNSAMDAITIGTVRGIDLLINIVAMLVVLVALVSLANLMLGAFPDVGGEALSLQRILGWIMAPVMWLIGIPWSEAVTAGGLMGIKTVLNEFLAYLQMASLEPGTLSERSRLILTYAMCGFANFGSLGIMIGGLGVMAPERRDEVVALGMKSIVAGTLSTLMTGAMVGMII